MEDPIRFDVWARIRKGMVPAAAEDLAVRWSSVRRKAHLKAATKSVATGEPMLVARSVRWSAVQDLRSAAPRWLEALLVFQEGYGPGRESLLHCAAHDLHHAGILGCHVCSGFHEP